MATKLAPKKKPIGKKVVAKKTVAKKPTARKKAPAKKKHIIKRILSYKIKGFISRKSLIIGLAVAVLAVGSFAGYSLWQGLSADAGACKTLGRKATAKQKTTYNQCVAKEKAAAAAKAKAAAAKAKTISDAKVAAAKAAAAAAAAAAAKKEAALIAANTGWTRLDDELYLNNNGGSTGNDFLTLKGVVDVCKTTAGAIKAKLTITSSIYPASLSVYGYMQDSFGGPAIAKGNAVAAVTGNVSTTSASTKTYAASANVPESIYLTSDSNQFYNFGKKNGSEKVSNVKYCP